jgi:hypothetical protein
MVVRLSAVCANCPLPPGRIPVIISVRGSVNTRALVQLEELGQLKNPVTSSGIKSMTFQLVAYVIPQQL